MPPRSPSREAALPAHAKPVHPRPIRLEPLVLAVERSKGKPTVVAYDARTLFDRANAALMTGHYHKALGGYRRMLKIFPDSRLVDPAMYNAGLACEGIGDYDAAVSQYQQLARRARSGRDARDALIRAAAVLAELKRWPQAKQALVAFLARTDLTRADRIEGFARLGYVLLETSDYTGAQHQLRRAVEFYVNAADHKPLAANYYVGMAYFYLAEIPHRQFEAIPLRLPDAQMQRDVETKAGLVILAHKRYDKVIDFGNAYWATAAGYELAAMQKQFWDAIVTAPIPSRLSARARRMYVHKVHEVARIFLRKALRIHRENVELAAAYKTSTPWSEASKLSAASIARLLAEESAGELAYPTRGGAAAPEPGAIRSAFTYVPGRTNL